MQVSSINNLSKLIAAVISQINYLCKKYKSVNFFSKLFAILAISSYFLILMHVSCINKVNKIIAVVISQINHPC